MFESENGARVGAATAMVGVSLLYFGTRFALRACASERPNGPGRRAVLQWLPVPATVAALVALGNPQMAVGVIFGTSVACLSLVLGLAAMTGPLHDLPAGKRVWPLVLPPALLVLLIGFRGSFTWYHAIMLLAMGVGFMAVWREPAVEPGAPFAIPVARSSAALPRTLLAIILTILGGVIAAAGGIDTSNHSRVLTASLMSSSVISPLIMLPAVGSATMRAHRGQLGQVVTSLCGTVQLNLCALLPAVILCEALRPFLPPHININSTIVTTGGVMGQTPFPVMTWRIDSVVLVLLAFALIPAAAGRWVPERFESILLVGVYFAYLAAQASLAVRLLS